MNPDLLRQRRNLIAVSAVLLVFDFANVTITKVSMLGTELMVGNAQVLMACAWVLWGYSLLRYYQYWKKEPDRLVLISFKQRFNNYARLFSSKYAPVPDGMGGFLDSPVIRWSGLKLTSVFKKYNIAEDTWIDKPVISVPLWNIVDWSVKSALFVCFQTPHVTDHVLPYVLAAAALIVRIFTIWHPHVAEPILTQATRCPF